MKQLLLYQAGGLFNAAERRHNSELERCLKTAAQERDVDLQITLPQRTALRRFLSPGEGFDVAGIVQDCIQDAASHDYILCNTDGADADSGTSVEYGVALGQLVAQRLLEKTGSSAVLKVPKVITYRTDFRTAPEKEVGLNAMLKATGTTHIYHPCFAVERQEFDAFYDSLAGKIVAAMLDVYESPLSRNP